MMCICSCLCLVLELVWCLLVSMCEGWCCCLVIGWWDMRVQAVLCVRGAWCWLYHALWSWFFSLFYCRLDLCCGGCYFGYLQFVCFPIYLSVFVVCFMFDWVCELFVECVSYLCGWGECFLYENYCVVFGLCCFLLANPFMFFCLLSCVWSSKEYVCCVCEPSVCLSVPSICQMCVFVWEMWFNSEIKGSLAFCALMLFMCYILCFRCSGNSLHVDCILLFGMLYLSACRMMFVKMVFALCILVVIECQRRQPSCL